MYAFLLSLEVPTESIYGNALKVSLADKDEVWADCLNVTPACDSDGHRNHRYVKHANSVALRLSYTSLEVFRNTGC